MAFSLCVFCGAGFGAKPEYAAAARQVGAELGRRGWTLVYGGGHVGLMRVVGVIPRFLHEREVAHRGLDALEIVASFAERKQRMGALADAFLSLPGGVGTLDELFEAWSWTQAGLQHKPCGMLNVAGYYDEFVRFLDRANADGFISPASRDLLQVATDVSALLDRLAVRA
jgi:uncharacterized protein (TIGR00730 family)